MTDILDMFFIFINVCMYAVFACVFLAGFFTIAFYLADWYSARVRARDRKETAKYTQQIVDLNKHHYTAWKKDIKELSYSVLPFGGSEGKEYTTSITLDLQPGKLNFIGSNFPGINEDIFNEIIPHQNIKSLKNDAFGMAERLLIRSGNKLFWDTISKNENQEFGIVILECKFDDESVYCVCAAGNSSRRPDGTLMINTHEYTQNDVEHFQVYVMRHIMFLLSNDALVYKNMKPSRINFHAFIPSFSRSCHGCAEMGIYFEELCKEKYNISVCMFQHSRKMV